MLTLCMYSAVANSHLQGWVWLLSGHMSFVGCCLLVQMVLDEFMSVQQMQLGHMWNKAAAWTAFKDVVDQGLIAFLAARCVCNGGRSSVNQPKTMCVLV